MPVAKSQSAYFAGLSRDSRNSVYPAVWQSDNHCRNVLRHEAAGGRGIESLAIFGNQSAGGDNAPTRNEGVGEHVRTKSQPAKSAGEIADLWIRTDEENFFLLPDRFSPERALSKMTVQPFGLMSRRHPLSSTRAAGLNSLREAIRPDGSRDVAGIKSPAIFQASLLLLLLVGLLRSLLHCALCLLCLLSFLGHVALLM